MRSILSKLWLGITSLVIIILLVVWLFQVGLLNSFYINERSDMLLKEGHKLSSMIAESEDFASVSEDIIQEIETFGASYNLEILYEYLDIL